MKSRVDFSRFSAVITIVTTILLVALMSIDISGARVMFLTIAAIAIPLLFISLWYAPLSIELTDNEIYINRSISPSKRIPLADIASVKRHNPKNAIRLCASGGFLGYWGMFSEPKVGKYFGYFGNTADCFLVELKSGKKYLLGCKNPDEMVEAINAKL